MLRPHSGCRPISSRPPVMKGRWNGPSSSHWQYEMFRSGQLRSKAYIKNNLHRLRISTIIGFTVDHILSFVTQTSLVSQIRMVSSTLEGDIRFAPVRGELRKFLAYSLHFLGTPPRARFG